MYIFSLEGNTIYFTLLKLYKTMIQKRNLDFLQKRDISIEFS